MIVKGAQKMAPKESERQKRELVTIKYIRKIIQHLSKTNNLNIAVVACLTRAFWGAARLGEVTVRATVPQLIRYTREPGRSLDYCMSQWFRDHRGHELELTAGRYAPKGGSPMESPHNQHLRLKGKGRYIDKRRDI